MAGERIIGELWGQSNISENKRVVDKDSISRLIFLDVDLLPRRYRPARRSYRAIGDRPQFLIDDHIKGSGLRTIIQNMITIAIKA